MANYPAAYEEGRTDYEPNTSPRNPYGTGSHAQAWLAGWTDAAADHERTRDAAEDAYLWTLWNGE